MSAIASFAYNALIRRWWLVVAMGLLGLVVGFAIAELTPKLYYSSVQLEAPPVLNPKYAVADAEQDIHHGCIQFFFCGGIVPYAPGVSGKFSELVRRYPRRAAGGLGCMSSNSDDREYARLYNQRTLRYLLQ